MKTKRIAHVLFKEKRWILYLLFLAIFILYSNIDLSEKREMVYFDSIDIGGEKITYNKTIQEVATPLFYEGGDKAVLLLHGFGGTPYEVKELAEFLAANNITVYVPLLAGHGTNLKDLSRVTWHDEYEDAKKALEILKSKYSEVYVGGLCTGGLLSMTLAENEEIDGIIVMSSPIVLSSKFVDLITNKGVFYSIRVITPYLRRIEYGISKDPEVARKLPSYDRFPVNGLITINDMTNYVKNNMNLINEPILIIQSKFDNRASPESADYIYNNINSKNKKIVWLESSGHVVTMDYDKQQVFEAVLDFIKGS